LGANSNPNKLFYMRAWQQRPATSERPAGAAAVPTLSYQYA